MREFSLALPRHSEPVILGFLDGSVKQLRIPTQGECAIPGDLIWIREEWAGRLDVNPKIDPKKAFQYCLYRAGSSPNDLSMAFHRYPPKWKSAESMPRWASRIFAIVEKVEAKNLHEMTNEDAIECGCPRCELCDGSPWGRGAIDDPISSANGGKPFAICHGTCEGMTALHWYAKFWDSIHGRYHRWENNDRVFVYKLHTDIKHKARF